MRSWLGLVGLALALSACVTVNKSVLDRSFMDRPLPIEEVHVYLPGDEVPEHTRIAILNAEGDVDVTNEAEMIDRLREEAGKLGANAIVLGEIRDPGTGERVLAAFLDTSANRRSQAIAVYVPSFGPALKEHQGLQL